MEKNQNNYMYHVPVMLQECLDGLAIHPDGVYVDLTFGGGGHSRAIYEKLSSKGKLIVFDQDKDAKANAWKADNFFFVASNFLYLKNQLRVLGVTQVDGILGDLGVSSFQFNQPERGFSIRSDERLDMRMNQQQEVSAYEVVNTYEEEELILIFRKYGELVPAKRLAQKIAVSRENSPITSTQDLINVAQEFAPKRQENKFFAQLFQAIRIEVNNELEVLEKMLEQTAEVLSPKGRLVIMSYHSLEDRLVKNFMKRGSFDGKIEKDFYGNVLKPFTEINRKPIVPSEEELANNSRARSAKLRIAEKNG